MDRNHEIYKHKHICLVGDHYNPLAIIRSLGEEGIKPIVLLCCENPYLVHHSKYIGELHIFKSNQEGIDYLIEHYSNEPLKPFVYNGSDDTGLIIDQHYDQLKDHFFFSNAQGSLEKYQNKYHITKLAENCGVGIPKEEILKVGEMPTSLRYPVFTKAVTSAKGGAWKDQAFICNTPEELKEAYNKIKADEILVQEFIVKKNELCIDGISINAGKEVFMPYGCGYYRFVPGSYGNYMKFTPFLDKELTEKIVKIIKGAKYTGIFCIEFMVGQNDELYFLEVNFRHSGWGYAFTVGGFNLPVRWAMSTLEEKINLDGFKYLDSFDAINDFSDFKDNLKLKDVSIFKWFKQYKNSECKYYYNSKDKKPFYFAMLKKFHLIK